MATPTFILPSAPTYTEGFVNGLNVYPNPTNFVANQVPFTRATTATRTNAAGLIELTPYNLVTYSEQFDNAAWTKVSGGVGSVPVVTANQGTAPNGTLTADRLVLNLNGGTTGTDRSWIDRAVTGLPSSGTMSLSVWLKSYDSNSYNIVIQQTSIVGGTPSVISVTPTWQRFDFTGVRNADNSQLRIGLLGGLAVSNSADLLIWGGQLNEGALLDYQLTETRLNRPRVDFSLGGCPNLLLEPQRTNNSRWSEDLTNVIWTKASGVTITADNTISPSGVQNADRVSGATGAAIWASPNTLSQSIGSLPSSTICTMTIYLRSSTTSSQVTLVLRDQTTGNTSSLVCNLTSSWQRFEISRTTGAATTGLGVVLGAATADFFAWGLQGEVGAFSTTYIPTSSASVTRNSDSFTLSNVFTNNMISSAGGTWVMDFRNNLSLVRDASANGLYLTDATALAFGFRIKTYAPNNRLAISKVASGTETPIYTTLTDTAKVAIKWNGTTADVFVNGVKVVTATAFTSTAMEVIATNVSVPIYLNDTALYPTPLSDTECINLTTI
jgi:hypothetical protein